jgi:hypothetical protein
MTIEQAFLKARDAGFIDTVPMPNNMAKIFLDPSFWQCLGKAMDWGTGFICYKCGLSLCKEHGPYMQPFLSHWHQFIDHLAAGKSAEDFFTSL